ncbi:cation:proton antiporter domain-containing protein [Portibacter marinus]|uniref:cation:proton antiporter domain-containing protein n=1 Tax=Portibacter marinus TaxID=2898660 RepID=UPI001F28A6E0|nr:cation:proton antiporter [Portibacter marinus]
MNITLLAMDLSSPYMLLIAASIVLIMSFFFGEISKRTSVPSVLLLIILGVLINLGLQAIGENEIDFFPILEILGIVGLIMIVLEAALELKLDREKVIPITIALAIALIGLLASAWVTAIILQYFIPELTELQSWIYATPLSILSSAIIIPSVVHLRADKKEFHIYESTFSDILGIMVFYFLVSKIPAADPELAAEHAGGGSLLNFGLTTLLTVVLSLLFSYVIVFIFQRIKSTAKLFLLISVLLLLYSIGKLLHLSPLFIILVFGLVIANMELFFSGPLKKWLNKNKAQEVYHGLHLVTLETAFVVRTFFFVIFGITIVFSTLLDWKVIGISALCLAVIYVIRFILIRVIIGRDILPQLFVAPRGLITVLLYYAIPPEAQSEGFSEGILLFIIIGTSLVMTWAMINNNKRSGKALGKAKALPVGETKWKVPEIN